MTDDLSPVNNRKSPRIEVYAQAEVRGKDINIMAVRNVSAGGVYLEGTPLDEVAARGLRAKIRCGGERVPSVADLAGFIRGCRERGLVFKATAGLHHAYPTEAGEHGFLNVLAAAVFGDEEEALQEKPRAFMLDAASFRWRDREALPTKLADVRASLLHSIGTCSFFEPVAELEELGIV